MRPLALALVFVVVPYADLAGVAIVVLALAVWFPVALLVRGVRR